MVGAAAHDTDLGVSGHDRAGQRRCLVAEIDLARAGVVVADHDGVLPGVGDRVVRRPGEGRMGAAGLQVDVRHRRVERIRVVRRRGDAVRLQGLDAPRQLLDVGDRQRGAGDAREVTGVGVLCAARPGERHLAGDRVAGVHPLQGAEERVPALAVGIPARDRPVGPAAGRRGPPLQHGLVDHRRVLDPGEQEDRLAVLRRRLRRDGPLGGHLRYRGAGVVRPRRVGDPAAAERRHDLVFRHVHVERLQRAAGRRTTTGPWSASTAPSLESWRSRPPEPSITVPGSAWWTRSADL